jgi:8-oxo-dGTP pyrophosphatase MutT (NUDIX family)
MSESPLKNIDFQEAVKLVTSRLSDYQPMRLYKDGIRSSAVMILLLNKMDVPHILFTKRTDLVETHKGQISFPGGVADSSDESLLHTALRETHEEIGINSDLIEPLGQLDDFYTITEFIVSPFAGFVNSTFEYQINHSEVAEVLEVPLSLFLMNQNFEVKKWEHKGTYYDVYFYYYGESVIWGATAFILNRFVHQVFGYNPAPNPVSEDPRNVHYLRENKVRKGSR